MTRYFAILLACALPGTALAWEHLGQAWHEDDFPIGYYVADHHVTPLPEDFQIEVIRRAWEAWEVQAPCAGISSELLGLSENVGAAYDFQNRIAFDDPRGIMPAGVLAWVINRPQGPAAPFLKQIDGQNYTRILDSDMEFNDNVLWDSDDNIEAGSCNGGGSIQATATHEVGHMLGMGHSCEQGDACLDPVLREATMFWTSDGNCSTARSTLNSDDIEGITALYGPSASFVCSNELAPGDPDTVAFGVVDFELKCVVRSDFKEQINNVTWYFGDGGVAEGFAVSHTYETPGNYTLRIEAEGYNEECGDWFTTSRRVGYVRACDVPSAAFTFRHVNGLTYQLMNETDVSVYGCIFDIAWDIFDSSGSRIHSVKAWEPQFTFPEPGEYRVVLNVGGPAGTGAAELTVHARNMRGDGYGCSTVGGLGGLGLAFSGLLGAVALRRRRS